MDVDGEDGTHFTKSSGAWSVGDTFDVNGAKFKVLQDGELSIQVPIVKNDELQHVAISKGVSKTETVQLDNAALLEALNSKALVATTVDGANRIRVVHPAPDGVLKAFPGHFVEKLNVQCPEELSHPTLDDVKRMLQRVTTIKNKFAPHDLVIEHWDANIAHGDVKDHVSASCDAKITYNGVETDVFQLPESVLNHIKFFGQPLHGPPMQVIRSRGSRKRIDYGID